MIIPFKPIRIQLRRNSRTDTIKTMPIEHLVLDSSAFIHNGPIRETGTNLYTCPEAIAEIKDKATLERLRILPYELKMLQFDKEELEFCCEFAKKTGDYKQLSIVDLKLISATYRLEKQYNGLKYINSSPREVTIKQIAKSNPMNTAVAGLSDIMDAANIDDTPITDADMDAILDEEAGAGADEFEEDDEEGWITPANIDNVYKKFGRNKPESITTDALMADRVLVACMTSDFSIQNCLLQMGLLVVSPVDGLMIKEAKQIALRCHACYKVFHDPSRIKNEFCPHCGNRDTLKRVQYVIDKNGEKKVLINFKRPIKVKGTNQQLPRPRGGKHANNPILAPDQKVRRDKQDKMTLDDKKSLTIDYILRDPAYLVRTNPFAQRSSQTGGRRRK